MGCWKVRRTALLSVLVALGLTAPFSSAQGDGACGADAYSGRLSPGPFGATDLVLSDFTGDGRLDAAMPARDSQAVTVFPADGPHGFGAGLTRSGVSGAFRLACGDLDGDGDIDLASTASFRGVFCVLLNKGNGSLAEPIFFGSGVTTFDVTLADFDGDGDLDAALPGASRDEVYVFLNDGVGGFDEQRTFAVGDEPSKLAAGDLDGDGDADLLVVHFRNQRIALLNDGAANFAIGDVGAAGVSSPNRFELADLDNDGDLDGIATGASVEQVLYRNDGDAVFTIETWRAGGLISDIGIGDVNGDGLLDIVASHSGTFSTPGTSLLVNAGDGTFEPDIIVGQSPNALVALGDTDGDGLLDAVAATPSMTVLPNELLRTGRTTFELYDTANRLGSVHATDIDGDGDVDVLAPTQAPVDGVLVMHNDGSGALLPPVVFRAGTDPVHLAVADIDGDGDADVALVSRETRTITMLKNSAGTLAQDSTIVLSGWPLRAALEDVNGDGFPDAIATLETTNQVAVALNTGTGRFGPRSMYGVGQRPSGLAVGDADGDGWLDLLVTNPISQDASLLINDGSGGFQVEQRLDVRFTRYSDARLVDLDGDGIVEAVFAGNSWGFLRGLGDGAFGPLESQFSGLRGVSLDTGDVDGDGLLDVARPSSVAFQAADGFGTGIAYAPQLGDWVALADLTGNGRLDLISSQSGDSEIYVLRNRCAVAACPADLDGDGELTIFDFLAFGNLFDLMDPRADFDGDGAFTIFDFLAFQNAFGLGCP
ncbi:MAG: VCBS repeat-containing protein [Phycisphaerales bacterium]